MIVLLLKDRSNDICIGVPCIIKNGVEEIIEIELNDKEKHCLLKVQMQLDK
jgi:malate/lactate dehydrogenase